MITNIIEAIDLYITLLEDKGAPYSKNPYWKKPLQLYHGTNKEFDKFDLSKSGSSNDHGMYGKGIYLTNNKNVAKAFGGKGGHIKKVDTTFKNPLYIKNRKHEKQVMRDFNKSNNVQQTNGSEKYPKPTKEFSDKFRKYLTDKGYDGYISSIPKRPKYGKMRQYVALNPDQAKIAGKITEGEAMSISEACYNNIIDLVEEYINEAIPSIVDKPGKNIGSKAFRQDWARVMKAREGSDLKVTSTKPKPTGLQTAKSTLRNVKKSIKKEGVTPEKQQKARELASQVTELTKKRKRESGSPFTVMYTTEDFNTLCEALLGLAKPKKQEVSPKMLELRDRILKANKVEEQPKQHKRKIEVPKVTVQGVFGEAVEGCLNKVNSILEKVTVSQWKQAAKNVLKDRERKAWDTDTEKDLQRELHADKVAELPDSKVSANKVLNAAKKVAKKRDEDYFQADNKGYKSGTADQQKERAHLEKRADKAHFLSHKNSVN